MRRAVAIPFRRIASAFTLVEVVIAIMITSIMSFAVMSSIMLSSRSSRLNTNATAAKNIAQGYFERMAIDTFANVGNAAVYPNVAIDDDPPVWLDQEMQIRCAVAFEFKGFGVAEAGGVASLTDNDADWEAGEWAGDTVYIVAGAGAGQFVEIESNSGNTLQFAEDLIIPASGTTRYMVNNGKTVEITTTWLYMDLPYTQTIESLVVNYRNDQNLGF